MKRKKLILNQCEADTKVYLCKIFKGFFSDLGRKSMSFRREK